MARRSEAAVKPKRTAKASAPKAATRRRARATDAAAADGSAVLLRELVGHLRENRSQLREEWARRITDAQLLTAMSPEEIFSEATSVYDNYVEVLETGSVEALQDYARNLSERIIRQQQEAIRELSTPVLQVRERLLILPIIGVLDSQRARQVTEQLLRGIRSNRAKVVVMDITGVPTVDSTVANHLVQTVEASRLMGASVIITGLSSEIAQTLVTIGVDLSKMTAVGDLQGGIEQAERLLGYEVTKGEEEAQEMR